MSYFETNLKGIENRFSNVFFTCCASGLKKMKKYLEQILVLAPQCRMGVSAQATQAMGIMINWGKLHFCHY